jgi:RNA polymerase sigma factor (sigma-70 family)
MNVVMTREKAKPASSWNDTRLVKECLAGNEEAWSYLIEKYKALIYSIPVSYGFPAHEASDIFQATCMELLARLPELREPRALPKWLMQVAHHQCYRRKQQESRTVSWDAETNIPEPQIPPMAESIVRETQEGQMLREATEALSPQCRRLIEMLFFETPSRPYAEVAAELGLAPGSIGFTRQKCIDRLRRHLDKLGFR